jgi:hypothetical protein
MDEIVKQAMAKWPNVPHCYGWLRLDARGAWRMCDERAQASRLPGDKISNAALLDFIHRNYTHDDQGRWYFQNGPQRVYVDLELTPFIAHTDADHGLALQTGESFSKFSSVWMTEQGQLIFCGAEKVAALDDRDLAQFVNGLRIGNSVPSNEQFFAWLDGEEIGACMTWLYQDIQYPVRRILQKDLASRFNFVQRPRKHFP